MIHPPPSPSPSPPPKWSHGSDSLYKTGSLPGAAHGQLVQQYSMPAVCPLGHCDWLQGLEGTGISSFFQPAEQAIL